MAKTTRFLKYILNSLVKSKHIPLEPIAELHLQLDRPIVYALKTDAISDKLTLQLCCKKLGLPDPLSSLTINGRAVPRLVCLDKPASLFGKEKGPLPFIPQFQTLLELHRGDPKLDIQLVPTTLFWGRAPGYEGESPVLSLIKSGSPHRLKKALIIAFRGRDNLIRFNKAVSLREMAQQRGTDPELAHKLARLARVHFSRQKLAATGPKLPNREQLFHDLLNSKALKSAIIEQAQRQGVTEQKVCREAQGYFDEIASDFSYRLVRFGHMFLTWLWNKLYRGIKVSHSETVRQLAHDGHEIVFMPCHRSHMDYLLLSYVLYQQGMTPPHIAAGINLNFWPAGPIFRRGGAFFIRRTFKGNKLYTTVFREYLSCLFNKGYSVEFFTEGGRSRTGRLLPPKTGMLAMTLEAMLKQQTRPITLVPVCLGYDHVMEVSTYMKELKGQHKQKESIFQVLGILKKLRNFGHGFVNFGQPINLNQHLTQYDANWRELDVLHKPDWFQHAVSTLANQVMTGINSAAAVNALPLCCLILLATNRNSISKELMLAQLTSYLELLTHTPFSPLSTLPEGSAEEVLNQAIEMNKFHISKDSLGEIISLDSYQAIQMTYYRNNIIHLFALPSLIATLLLKHKQLPISRLRVYVEQLYPLLKAELFLPYSGAELEKQTNLLVKEMQRQELINGAEQNLQVNQPKLIQLSMLSKHVQETLQRYQIVITLLQKSDELNIKQLSNASSTIAERLAKINGISAPEFFDAKVMETFIRQLKLLGCINSSNKLNEKEIMSLSQTIRPLISTDVLETIEHMIHWEKACD